MPFYEYRCLKCGERVEKIQKFSDPPFRICARCGGILERLLSSPAIQFKGSGWYVTDYSHKSSPPSDKSEVSNPDRNKKGSETPAATTTKDTKPSSDK